MRPVHYDLTITPDLDKKKFYGEIAITVDIKKPTKQIKMHQRDLEINHETTIKQGDKSWQVSGTADDNKTETVLFKFPEEIPKHSASVIHIKWTGDLKKDMIGLYRTTYFDNKGRRRATIATQFESTNARRCFPCFDEPKSKATFSIRIIMEARFHVLSNMPPDTEDNIMPNVYPPMREWRFQKTPPMSTYLVGFTAGEWDRVERKTKSKVLVRTWAPLGHAKQAELGCEFAVRVVEFFEDYFDCPYPLPKLDLVPIQDFEAGAMENWGVITFKPYYLLVDESTSQSLIYQIKEVIAHEIAHMWFGNLVTPRYWDALWLKEGFATYFAFFVCGALEPDQHWKTRYLVDDVIRGKELDGNAATHPLEVTVTSAGEVKEIYDAISYCKGAALINAVESYIGKEAVQEGLRKYIEQFKYKNAASLDLWLALGKASKVEGPPLKDVMKDWVKQDGYPVVTVERTAPNKLKLTQKRFGAASSTQRWAIPLRIATSVAPAEYKTIVMTGESEAIDIDAKATWVLVNAGQGAFVTVNYATAELRSALESHFHSLTEQDQVGLVADAIALFHAGSLSLKDLVSLFNHVAAKDATAPVWEMVIKFFDWALAVWDDDVNGKQALQKAGRAVFANVWKAWGFSAKQGEDPRVAPIRGQLIELLAKCDEKPVLLAAQEMFDAKGPLGVEPNTRAGVWSAVIIKGNRLSLDALVQLAETSRVDSDVRRALTAIQQTRNTGDIGKHFQMVLPKADGASATLKPQSLTDLLRGLQFAPASSRKAAWSFIQSNWEALIKAGGGPSAVADEMLKVFENSADEAQARQLKDFVHRLDAETKGYVGKVVEQVAASIKENHARRVSAAGDLKNI